MIDWKRLWLATWIFALVVKTILVSVLPLSNDEAYYWIWSHNLQWSYYDHPAGVSWLLWLGHVFEPFNLPGMVRIPAVVLGHLTLLIVRRLVKDEISDKQQFQWLCVVLLSPFFGIGSLIITPDVPLVFMWTVSLLAFKNHLESPSLKNASLLGAALGIGFCAKYHIVLFVPVATLYVLWKRQWSMVRPMFLVSAALCGIIFSAPVWGWNAAHDWISFRFQLDHGLRQQALKFDAIAMQFGDYVGAQLGLLSPLVFLLFKRRDAFPKLRFLEWFGWGPLLFFAWTSLRSPVEANWPIASHLPLLVLAAVSDMKQTLSRAIMGVWFVATAIAINQGFNPERNLFGIPAQNLKTYEFARFQALEKIATEQPTLFASSYQMAGALSVAAGRTVPKLSGLNRKDFFDYHESGFPRGPSFVVAMPDPEVDWWPWPAWIKELGYSQTGRTKVEKFTLVTFEKTENQNKATAP